MHRVYLYFLAQKQTSTETSLQWVHNPDHGLTEAKAVGDYLFTCTAIPSALLNRSVRNTSARNVSNTSNILEDSVPVRVVLSVSRRNVDSSISSSLDVLFDGVQSDQEYTIRIREVAFRMHNNVRVVLPNGTEYNGCDTFMEHTVGVGKRRSVIITLNIPESVFYSQEKATIVWKDPFFGAGLLLFNLTPNSIQQLSGFTA